MPRFPAAAFLTAAHPSTRSAKRACGARLPFLALLPALAVAACASSPVPPEKEAIRAMLDDWNDAAAHADEARYFGHFASEAVFLGTDDAERWDVAAFRAYAHPYFAKGKGWSYRAVRRDITVAAGASVAWFDEELARPDETQHKIGLGPARGSGVVVKRDGEWRIAQYNLTFTVPNKLIDDAKNAGAPPAAPVPAAAP
jgi:hypothetical protein